MAATEAAKAAGDTEIEKLHVKIGQLVVEREHASLSIAAQCRLVSISRSSFYYAPIPETTETLALMAKMGLASIYQRPRTSGPHPEHRIYPYLLRDLEIIQPGHVWCADITYLPMRRGFLYLVAVMDWASRKVFA